MPNLTSGNLKNEGLPAKKSLGEKCAQGIRAKLKNSQRACLPEKAERARSSRPTVHCCVADGQLNIVEATGRERRIKGMNPSIMDPQSGRPQKRVAQTRDDATKPGLPGKKPKAGPPGPELRRREIPMPRDRAAPL